MTLVVQKGPTGLAARAIAARLALAFPAPKFSLEFLPARLDAKVWNELLQVMPFVGVGWVGGEQRASGRRWQGKANFAVALVTENKHGMRSRLFGDSFAPGLFDMVDAATAILTGYTAPGLGTVSVDKTEVVFSEALGDDKACAMLMASCPILVEIGSVLAGPELQAPEMQTAQWSWEFVSPPGQQPPLPPFDYVITETEPQT